LHRSFSSRLYQETFYQCLIKEIIRLIITIIPG
jgi:hypothetical protein